MVTKALKRFFRLDSIEEKIDHYIELEKQESIQKSVRDELAIAYTNQKNIFDNSVISTDEFVKVKVKEKYDLFIDSYMSELKKAKGEYDQLKSKRVKLLQNEEFAKAVKLYKARQLFDNNEFSLIVYDNIIKAVTKKEVKYADSIVFNSNRELLLLKRAKGDENAGKWVIPGGHVDPGEIWEDAAKRELKEEAGIDLDKIETCSDSNVLSGEYKKNGVHIKYYMSYLKEKNPTILLDDKETHDYEWVKVEDLKDYEMVFDMKENIDKIIHPWKQKVIQLKKSLDDEIITPQIFNLALKNIIEKSKKEIKEINNIEKADKYSKDQLKDMISEHERLIKILNPYAKMDKKVSTELDIQNKELEGYKKQLSTLTKGNEVDDKYTLSLNDFEKLNNTIKKAEELVQEVNEKIEGYGK